MFRKSAKVPIDFCIRAVMRSTRCNILTTIVAVIRVVAVGHSEILGGADGIEEIKACANTTAVPLFFRSSNNAMIFAVFPRPENLVVNRLNLESRIYCPRLRVVSSSITR